MADDDGMLVNFAVSDGPFKPQIKITGGRWRDRKQAERNAKRALGIAPSPRADRVAKDVAKDGAQGPPAKRQRLSEGASINPPRHRPDGHGHNPGQPRSQHVTSRLFTANPTPVTNFEDLPPATTDEDAEPAEPSNAPLSDEAATFHALGLSRRIAQHLTTKLEIQAPTGIQKNSVTQLVKSDDDAFLQAETGSGKTLAYLLPIVNRILALSLAEDGSICKDKDKKIHRNSGLFAIVLAPTRELCRQIATVLEKLLRCAPWLVSTTVTGGESKHSEKARLRKGVNILIATPGRLTDHLENTTVLDVGMVRWLVLDEGDRMMEMGFEDDLRKIVDKMRKAPLQKENKEGVALEPALPARRVTVLCSATMKMHVNRLGEISLVDAVHITAAKSDGGGPTAKEESKEVGFSAPTQLKQSYIVVPAKVRLVTLIALLKASFSRRDSIMKAIVFMSCAHSVDFHFGLFRSEATKKTEKAEAATPDSPKPVKSHTDSTVSKAHYITSTANPNIVLHKLHGSLEQPVRTATLRSFAASKDPAVLITTDISSRGLDVPEVDLVIEYDPAFAVDDHVHRIGRTARAGRSGRAVLFLQPGCEEGYVSIIKSKTPLAPQLYDTVLQEGLSADVNLPPVPKKDGESDDKDDANDDDQSRRRKQTWTSRAEALQLHIEQRILASSPPPVPAPKGGKKGQKGQKQQPQKQPQGSKDALINLARTAFRAHVGAYATHVKDERVYFDMTQLHLGHMAKSFGLREAPGGLGAGVQRRTHKPSGGKKSGGGGGGGGADSDDEGGKVDEEAAKRMRMKMKMVGAGASEFNIG